MCSPGGWHRPELDPHSEGVWWLCCAIRERKGFYKTKNSNLNHMWGAFWEHRDISWWLEGHFGLRQESTQKWAHSHFRNHASGPTVTLKAGYLCTLQKDANKQHNSVTFCILFLFFFFLILSLCFRVHDDSLICHLSISVMFGVHINLRP